MTKQSFIEFVKGECIKHNVSFCLGGQQVNVGGFRANGYFIAEKPPKLALCSPIHLPTVVHEYCHLLQWLDYKDAFEKIPELELELDCEKRVIELIKKYKLRISIGKYIRTANAYIMTYGLDNYRSLKVYPSEVESIIKKMPEKFLSVNKYKNPPKWFVRECQNKCF